MERHGDEIHLEPREARAGAGPRSMRTVLLLGILLVVLAFGIIWAFKGWNAADVTDPAQRAAASSAAPMDEGPR